MQKDSQSFIPSSRQVLAIRMWAGIKQRDFAKLCSVSRTALADYEIAKRQPRSETLKAIAAYIATIEGVTFSKSGKVELPE